jgi:hypothetical protein
MYEKVQKEEELRMEEIAAQAHIHKPRRPLKEKIEKGEVALLLQKSLQKLLPSFMSRLTLQTAQTVHTLLKSPPHP